jgi:hypothetical protein
VPPNKNTGRFIIWYRPRLGKKYNNRCPNHVKKWAKELLLTRKFIYATLCVADNKPEYDEAIHLQPGAFDMVFDARAVPNSKTAWKWTRFFQIFAPHQKLMPRDLFPKIVFDSHIPEEGYGCYHPKIHATKTLVPANEEEVKKIADWMADLARPKDGDKRYKYNRVLRKKATDV